MKALHLLQVFVQHLRDFLSEWLWGKPSTLSMARGLCIWGVVAIHFTGGRIGIDPNAEQTFTRLLYLGVNQWFQFVVPCFVFFSGYALAAKPVAWPAGIGPFYWRRASAVLGAYACFVVAYLGFEVPPSEIAAKGGDVLSLAIWVCYYGMDTHGYFVPLIMQLYLIHPLISQWNVAIERSGKAPWLQWGGLGACVALLVVLAYLVYDCGALSLRDVRPCGLYYLAYFCLGVRWRAWSPWLERHRALAFGLGLMGFAMQFLAWGDEMRVLVAMPADAQLSEIQWGYFHPRAIVQAFGTCLGFGALFVLWPTLRLPLVQSWGSHSLGIFLWHGFVLWAWVLGIRNPFGSVPTSPVALWVPVAVCTLIAGASIGLRAALQRLHR
ncbi:MAG: acyltransferase [Roseimicrobium sp.]